MQVMGNLLFATLLIHEGGWVRDKLLGAMVKHDIDIALDDMTGLEFAKHLQDHLSKSGTFFSGFGIIQPNAEKSKHLETGQEMAASIPIAVHLQW
jgi:tRNA nucleotidyltransferase/poly(A) polymerase